MELAEQHQSEYINQLLTKYSFPMNAMIFAAGLGTRLRPLTDHRPKALIEVEGKTLLEHNILKLKDAGFDHIVVNVHHFGEQIIDFLKANDNFGIDIRVSDERGELLDTGGGIKAAFPLFEEDGPILIHNVDIISDIDVRAIYDAHVNAAVRPAATLAVNQRKTQRYLLFNEEMNLCGWTNIATGELKPAEFIEALENDQVSLEQLHRFAFSGIHVVDQQLVPYFMNRDERVFPIMDFYLSICHQVHLHAVDVSGLQWVDCGKPESLSNAVQIVRKSPSY